VVLGADRRQLLAALPGHRRGSLGRLPDVILVIGDFVSGKPITDWGT
jgi:hypothetical protein